MLTLAVTSVSVASGTSFRTVTVKRCGILNKPDNLNGAGFFPSRLGIYPVGFVTCAEGRQLITRVFEVEGKPTGAGDTEHYPDGWACGGQMGQYICQYPYSRHRSGDYTEEVLALSCSEPGCPDRTTAEIANATHR